MAEYIEYHGNFSGSQIDNLLEKIQSSQVFTAEEKTKLASLVNYDDTEVIEDISDIEISLNSHKSDMSNPHQVTKAQIGLGNVDNMSTKDVLAELVDAGAKNFLKNEATSQSIVTVNADGTITINGTAPANTDINITISTTTTLEPGDYIWSIANGASSVYFSVRPGATGTTQYTCTGATTNIQFSIDERTTINRIYLFINRGTTVQELTFKPMICTKAAWDISQEYVPYRPSYDELVARIDALEKAGD